MWQDIRDLAGNKPWLVLFCLALIIMITITMRASSAVYYFKYYLQQPQLIGEFLSVYMLGIGAGGGIDAAADGGFLIKNADDGLDGPRRGVVAGAVFCAAG